MCPNINQELQPEHFEFTGNQKQKQANQKFIENITLSLKRNIFPKQVCLKENPTQENKNFGRTKQIKILSNN